jgi:hypothetical protein
VSHSPVRPGAVRLALAVAVLLAPWPTGAAEVVTPGTLGVYDAGLVRRAVEGARARLQAAACQGLVDEFKDPEGVTLRQRLDEQGMTIESRLDAIRFVDASESSLCRTSQSFAFTVRSGIVVYVCPRVLEKAHLRQPARVQAVIIHELLHTIGLGENPPTSTHITARVEARCLSN